MRNVFLNVIRNSIRVLQFPVKKLGNRSAKKSAHSFERSAKRVPLNFRFSWEATAAPFQLLGF